jgi:hypothetical protein
LGGIFLYAGIMKALDPGAFVGDLRGFQVFPETALPILAAFVPYLEIFVGAALVLGVLYSGALFLSGGQLLTFAALLASAMWRGLDISCGCFGRHAGGDSVEIGLLRDGILLLIWFALVWIFVRQGAKPRQPSPDLIGRSVYDV